MCKKIVLAMSLVLALSLGVSGAWGAIINCPDVTLIQDWIGTVPAAGNKWADVIGGSVFQTTNATFNTDTHELTINTNHGENTSVTLGLVTFVTADLFLNYTPDALPPPGLATDSGTALAAIRLFGPDKGTVYYDPTITTSRMVNGTNATNFGGKYSTDAPIVGNNPAGSPPDDTIFNVPVIGDSADTGTVPVTWTGTSPYSVTIDLSGINGLDLNNFSFLWGTSTCGNDVITCNIPLPPSMLLLGSGLLGLLGWRRFRKS